MNNPSQPPASPRVASSRKEKLAALIFLPLIAIGLWLVWSSTHDPRVDELNDMLMLDEELAAYPYHFRVFELENGVAVMSSPRSPQSSVLQALKIIAPEMSVADPNRPEVIAAQKKLAGLQMKARKLVIAQPDVDEVQWRLDRGWLKAHGAFLD